MEVFRVKVDVFILLKLSDEVTVGFAYGDFGVGDPSAPGGNEVYVHGLGEVGLQLGDVGATTREFVGDGELECGGRRRNGDIGQNFSEEPSARPPEMMIFAAVNSGRSEAAISSETNFETPLSPAAATVSMADKYVPPHAQAMLFQFKIEKRRAEDLLRADRVSEILDRLQRLPRPRSATGI